MSGNKTDITATKNIKKLLESYSQDNACCVANTCVGQLVTCVNAEGYTDYLIVGKTYKVVDIYTNPFGFYARDVIEVETTNEESYTDGNNTTDKYTIPPSHARRFTILRPVDFE